MQKLIKIGRQDNVAVALQNLLQGETIELENNPITPNQDINCGHKIALTDIKNGENIIKYDMPIGHATMDIHKGDFIHTHNLKTNLQGTLEYSYEKSPVTTMPIPTEKKTFLGYRRSDGNIGIRNDLWIIPTVGCVNKLAENLSTFYQRKSGEKVLCFPHPYGCSQMGDDHETTANLLSSLAKHPNAGGVLIVALGCENNTLESFKKRLGNFDSARIKFIQAQDKGDEFEQGLELLDQLAKNAAKDQREPIDISELKVGLKCGGSDGLSGITANPLIGRFSDLLVNHGGTSVLTEVPEMFGAETLLFNRTINKNVFDAAVDMVNDFKEYFISHNQVVYENPSPGNKAGGITSLEEKSLGCVQKGGVGEVVDVLKYGEPLKTKGLNLLSGPGNDMVAVSALAVSGAHIVLFSTGRGTPFGGPVPTVKISTNTALATNKPNWIDFNAGKLLDQDISLDQLGNELLEYVLKLASGDIECCNEKYGYSEIAIFKDGITL